MAFDIVTNPPADIPDPVDPPGTAPGAPSLSVVGNVITPTLPAEPAYTGDLTARGYQYRPVGPAPDNTPQGDWVTQFQIGFDEVTRVGETIPRLSEAPALLLSQRYEVQWRFSLWPGGSQPWSASAFIETEAQTPYVAPALTGASLVANGASGLTASANVNKAGTGHVLLSQNASETRATVEAQGVQQVASGAGTIGTSVSSLAPGTYYAHFVFTDGQNTVSATSSSVVVSAPPTPGTEIVTISKIGGHDTLVGPTVVHFKATISGASISEPATEADFDLTAAGIIWEWDFGDPGSVSDKVTNLAAAHNNQNIAYGKHAAHVFDEGNYTVTCRAYSRDGTFLNSDTFAVNVTNPNTAFPGGQTILVGPADPAYPGAQIAVSIPDALNRARAENVAGRAARIMLRRGSTYSISARLTLNSAYTNLYFDAYGTGNRPIINIAQTNSIGQVGFGMMYLSSMAGDIVFRGIDFQGPWDSVTTTGQNVPCISFDLDDVNGPGASGVKRILVTDCLFSGWWAALTTRGGDECSVCLHNSTVTNWIDYGNGFVTGAQATHSMIGSRVTQSELADMNNPAGDPVKDGFDDNRHGPVRYAQGAWVYVSQCDMFSRNGWSGSLGTVGAQTVVATQPCIRAITSSTAVFSPRPRVTIERNAMEGGFLIVNLGDQNSGACYSPQVLIEKNIIAATCNTIAALACDYSGVEVRNNIFVYPDVPVWGGGLRSWIRHQDGIANGTSGRERDFPVRIHHNTFISLQDDTNRAGSDFSLLGGDTFSGYSDVLIEDNVLWAPNATVATDEAANLSPSPMQTVTGDWTSRFRGIIQIPFQSAGVPDTTYASPTNFVPTARPNVGSPVLADSTGATAIRDNFYGEIRVAPANRGAV
jgi:hypothetical protein